MLAWILNLGFGGTGTVLATPPDITNRFLFKVVGDRCFFVPPSARSFTVV